MGTETFLTEKEDVSLSGERWEFVVGMLICFSLHHSWVQSLGQEDPLEKEITYSRILAWKIPWIEKQAGYSLWGFKSDTRFSN